MAARRAPLMALVGLACALAGCGGSSSSSTSTSASTAAASPSTTSTSMTASASSQAPNQPGPEGIPLEAGAPLGPASSTTPGTTVDGIQCAPVEQLAYHIHAHLQVYVQGQPNALPGGIGIVNPAPPQQTPVGPFYSGGQCIYWLHTHTSDGVIHIESPTVRIYTLGNFFDEWHQPLSRTQVGAAHGKVTAFLNGKPWKQDPRAIPLLPHASVELDVGAPVLHPTVVSWAGANL